MNSPSTQGFLEKKFQLSKYETNVKREVIAGLTTFMTMSYILVVNPQVLSKTGMDFGAVFTSTAIAAVLATACMALYANMPFALASGMGLNAFFAYTVVLGHGYSWQMALTAVFIEGLIFLALTWSNVREAIVNTIPMGLKQAVSVGIGLYIAFIGLNSVGMIQQGEDIPLTLGNLLTWDSLITIVGVFVTGYFLIRRNNGAMLIGIAVCTILGILCGVAELPSKIVDLPPSIEPIFMQFDFSNVFTGDMLSILLTFLFVDMFDTIGTLVGVAAKADLLDEKGQLPNVKKALFADAMGTTLGAALGVSTVSTYVESASGVSVGGRTGLTALTTAGCFLAALLFAPVILIVPAAATAPILILVGLFMMSPVANIDFSDYTEAIPAFLTIVMMPLAYSIAEGIMFGVISYAGFKLLSGRQKEAGIGLYLLAAIFLLKYIFL